MDQFADAGHSLITTIREFGWQLDRNKFPAVMDGGALRLGNSTAHFQPPGQEPQHVERNQERSATGPRQGPAGWQGQAGGAPWTPGTSPPLFVGSLEEAYERQLTDVSRNYPGSRFWRTSDGIWLLAPSTVFEGLDRRALFIARIPHDPMARPAAWGFWDRGCIALATWIGPRHTNFPDGSICAFEPSDNAWLPGVSLTMLIDIYSVWAARHLHLELIGTWPGPQVARWRHERLLECQPSELCGCGSLDKRYADCCREFDRSSYSITDALTFTWETQSAERRPPAPVIHFLHAQQTPPVL